MQVGNRMWKRTKALRPLALASQARRMPLRLLSAKDAKPAAVPAVPAKAPAPKPKASAQGLTEEEVEEPKDSFPTGKFLLLVSLCGGAGVLWLARSSDDFNQKIHERYPTAAKRLGFLLPPPKKPIAPKAAPKAAAKDAAKDKPAAAPAAAAAAAKHDDAAEAQKRQVVENLKKQEAAAEEKRKEKKAAVAKAGAAAPAVDVLAPPAEPSAAELSSTKVSDATAAVTTSAAAPAAAAPKESKRSPASAGAAAPAAAAAAGAGAAAESKADETDDEDDDDDDDDDDEDEDEEEDEEDEKVPAAPAAAKAETKADESLADKPLPVVEVPLPASLQQSHQEVAARAEKLGEKTKTLVQELKNEASAQQAGGAGAAAAGGDDFKTVEEAKLEVLRLRAELASHKETSALKTLQVVEEVERSLVQEAHRALLALSEEHKAVVAQLDMSYKQVAADKLSEERKSGEAALVKQRDALGKQMEELKATLEAAAAKERAERTSALHNLDVRVQAFSKLLDWKSDYEFFTKKVHDISLSMLAIEDILEKGEPFESAWTKLGNVGKGDAVIDTAVKSVAPDVVKRGAPTLKYLQSRFVNVERAGRAAAFVPKSATQNIWGQLTGKVFAALTFADSGLVEGDDDLERLTRASYFINNNDLAGAVREIESLTPHTREVCQDWLKAAQQRLVVGQALDMIRSHVTTLELSFH